MITSHLRRAAAVGLVSAIVMVAVSPGLAAPVPTAVASVRTAVAGPVTDVRWRHHGGAVAAGIAAGVIAGGLAAAAASPYDYEPGYYYGGPVYYEPAPVYAAPPPVYYAPSPGPGALRQCWVSTDNDRGYGYWRPC